ncbi:hypothetical protein BTHE68_50530 [Burkholderia sp. THE68]|uniref:LysR substrate-binding domain-containing protein n=1 Tax=Burkholderia sp. THE68 TaxID=758782 RepID=UPI0013187795|nr:LysR substrate-binding domain-containing protein [Burkholderia sp. THE68]BBU31319.1 hypothetical protein BTHE68_50530 [Burkholderia sp. THE68]
MLTPEGRNLLERTQRLLREAEGIEQGVAAARAEPAGRLKVTAPSPVGVNILAPALPPFCRQHPKGKVELRLSERYVDRIEEARMSPFESANPRLRGVNTMSKLEPTRGPRQPDDRVWGSEPSRRQLPTRRASKPTQL